MIFALTLNAIVVIFALYVASLYPTWSLWWWVNVIVSALNAAALLNWFVS